IGLAVIGVLWAYDGWIQITYVAGEVQAPQKNLPKAIIFSTFLVIGVYALINMAYVYVLGIPAIASHPLVASETAQHLMGPMGASWVTALVMVSTFGACNGFILTGARIYYAMAKEGQFFKAVGKLHPNTKAPQASLILQGLWSMALVLSGSFEQLFTYVVFASWLFYALSCSAVLKLRKTHPELERPYQCWGYPVTPILFILFATWLMINTIMEAPQNALMGCGIILMGLPGYFYWKRTSSKPEEVTHVS
ncbi:MAG: amino acid permease, partial [Cyanobacteria bacterium]|nr:amino acid permease [Cyanobacteriota bacterium]